jgi:hypothetical protein
MSSVLLALGYQDPYGHYYPEAMADISSPPSTKRQTVLGKLMGSQTPLNQRIENKRMGIGRQKRAYVTWILSLTMLGVLIYELVYNAQQQGNPFSFKVMASSIPLLIQG